MERQAHVQKKNLVEVDSWNNTGSKVRWDLEEEGSYSMYMVKVGYMASILPVGDKNMVVEERNKMWEAAGQNKLAGVVMAVEDNMWLVAEGRKDSH